MNISPRQFYVDVSLNDRRVAVLRVFLKRTGTMENIRFWDILKANTKNKEDHTQVHVYIHTYTHTHTYLHVYTAHCLFSAISMPMYNRIIYKYIYTRVYVYTGCWGKMVQEYSIDCMCHFLNEVFQSCNNKLLFVFDICCFYLCTITYYYLLFHVRYFFYRTPVVIK